MAKISIEPVTRIEGHLKIDIEVEGGKVVRAHSAGNLFRGFEMIMQGRDPRDAQHLVQRICGVCPVSHARAASHALEDAFGVQAPSNARIVRNLVQGANFVQSHILHFYHLAALDYVKGPDVAPFVPRYEGDYRLPKAVNDAAVQHYLEALDMRRKSHEMLALFGGKVPHHVTFVPGGVTEKVTVDKIVSFTWRLRELQQFIDNVYVPDVLAVADVYKDYAGIGGGYGNFVSFGVFELDDAGSKQLLKRGSYINGRDGEMDPGRISEHVKHSWYAQATSNRNPSNGQTQPQPGKPGGYSWIKAISYNGVPAEVGPLARMWVNGDYRNGVSVVDRHAARALECKKVADAMQEWLQQLKPGEPASVKAEVPFQGSGVGLTEAPRGSLGHWVTIAKGVTDSYQCVPPTNWNCSPANDGDQPGPVERALVGTPIADPANPIEAVRVVRSFDP